MKVIIDVTIKDENGRVLCEEQNRTFDVMSRPLDDKNGDYIVNTVDMSFSFLSIKNKENQNDGRSKE